MEAASMSIDRWMDEADIQYSMEYYSAIKRNKFDSIVLRWINLEPVIQSEVREKQIFYIDTYIWNLEKWYWWTYLQGTIGDTDEENSLVDTVEEEEGGTNWESSINIYTLSCVKQIASGKLQYNTGS